jgi:predicted O-methyltransferase YrrM
LKILDFLFLTATRPSEAYGRIEGIADSRLERLWAKPPKYSSSSIESLHSGLRETLGLRLDEFLSEPALAVIEDSVRRRMAELPDDSPFPVSLNGDFSMARLCYGACRALRPRQVVETGVCYGVTTAFLLQALTQNGTGKLHSIDLPPLGRKARDFVGTLVPDDLRSRWVLHRGTTKALLPRVLKEIGSVEFFIHDSLHTRRNIQRELNLVTPYLSEPALVFSDDIDGNGAFRDWVDQVRPAFWSVIGQASKSSLLGIAAFPSAPAISRDEMANSFSGSK